MLRPRSLPEFQQEFATEADCAEFIIRHRWPDGFVCPRCRSRRSTRLESRAFCFECLDCGRQTSVTAGTVMHRSKLRLTIWFWAAHLLATHSNGISALQLAAQLGVNRNTAWLVLHKLRAAIADRDPHKLSGVVEVDQTEIPYRTKSLVGLPKGKIIVIGAVEIIDRDTGEPPVVDFNRAYFANTRPQRIRLARIPDEMRESIHDFVRANIAPGSTLLTDGHDSYRGLSEGRRGERYVLDQHDVRQMAAHLVLYWVHRVFALVKRWGLGTFHGFRLKHIDRYLEEYVFRFNRRRWRRVSFERILGFSADHGPHGYAEVVGRKPRPKRRNPPRRKRPRYRKTAHGMRQDKQPKLEKV